MSLVLSIRAKQSPAWEPIPTEERSIGGSGFAHIDDGTPLPEPKQCRCGRIVRAIVVDRWTARCMREALWGAGEMLPGDKPYKTPRKFLVYRHACFFCEVRTPYRHWIEVVRLQKSPGWDDPKETPHG